MTVNGCESTQKVCFAKKKKYTLSIAKGCF